MSRKKKIALIIGGVLIAFTVYIFFVFMNTKKITDNTTVRNIPLDIINDGNYVGNYTITPVEVEVLVTVENHKIISIELIKHFNGLG